MANQDFRFYDQLVLDTCTGAGLSILAAKIITAQARHESNIYDSRLFFLDNNLFGMKMPSKRKSPYIDGPSRLVLPPRSEGGHYAHFDSLKNSVLDLIHRLHYSHIDFSQISSTDDYCNFLVKIGYFTDAPSNYRKGLERNFNMLNYLN